MSEISKNLADLVTVRSIITLLFAIIVGYLALAGKVQGDVVVRILENLIAFWFGTKAASLGKAIAGVSKEQK